MSTILPNITTHLELLKEKVFQLDRWPHYGLLLDDLTKLTAERGRKRVLSFERTLLYGGKSVFAPIFHKHDYLISEQSPASAIDRGAYNAHMVNDERFMESGKRVERAVPARSVDLALIPNALHHTSIAGPGHAAFLSPILHFYLKPGGYLYIYEQFIEDYHQIPDDYVRYTPVGLETLLKSAGFEIVETNTTGGIFSSICYLLDTATEYVESGSGNGLEGGFERLECIKRLQGMSKRIRDWDAHYPINKIRPESACPKAFSVLARAPV
jgi:hypothetical protein